MAAVQPNYSSECLSKLAEGWIGVLPTLTL